MTESIFIRLNAYLCLQSIFQCFTGTEFRSFSSSDGQRLASFRVTALTLCALTNVESTETDQSDGIAFFQSVGYSIGSGIQSFLSGSFRNTGFLSNCFDQFRLIHNQSLPIVENNEMPEYSGLRTFKYLCAL